MTSEALKFSHSSHGSRTPRSYLWYAKALLSSAFGLARDLGGKGWAMLWLPACRLEFIPEYSIRTEVCRFNQPVFQHKFNVLETEKTLTQHILNLPHHKVPNWLELISPHNQILCSEIVFILWMGALRSKGMSWKQRSYFVWHWRHILKLPHLAVPMYSANQVDWNWIFWAPITQAQKRVVPTRKACMALSRWVSSINSIFWGICSTFRKCRTAQAVPPSQLKCFFFPFWERPGLLLKTSFIPKRVQRPFQTPNDHWTAIYYEFELPAAKT